MHTDKTLRVMLHLIVATMIEGNLIGGEVSQPETNLKAGVSRDDQGKGLKGPRLVTLDNDEGFVSMFNGQNLDGWKASEFTVAEGVLVCHGHHGGGLTYTEAEFTNFVLRFEVKLSPGANNGLNFRTDGAIWNEIQILDDVHPTFTNIHPYQAHGSLYGLGPAKRGFLKPAGQWNDQEVVADGRRVKVTLNGTVILEVDLDTLNLEKGMDGAAHPGLRRTHGWMGWLGHLNGYEKEGPVYFRNIRIKALP